MYFHSCWWCAGGWPLGQARAEEARGVAQLGGEVRQVPGGEGRRPWGQRRIACEGMSEVLAASVGGCHCLI